MSSPSLRHLKIVTTIVALIAAWAIGGTACAQVIKINLDLTGIPAGTTLATRAGFQKAFADAEKFWESRLIGFSGQLPDTIQRTVGEIKISGQIAPVDGSGGILGFASVSKYLTYLDRRPFGIPQTGDMVFDVADATDFQNQGLFDDIVRHEMAHVLGFQATAWARNRLNLGPNNTYTGAFALKRYRQESGRLDALFVPVEQLGGPGTALSHWDSTDPFFYDPVTNTGDIMLGFITEAPRVSETTWSVFADLGFKVKGINDRLTRPVPGAVGPLTPTGGRRTTSTN
jgi:hypothetical protein